MNEKTVFTYENMLGKLTFKYEPRQLWITDIDGVSSVDIDISESQSNGQIGSTIASGSVQPKDFSVDGAVFDPIPRNRKAVIDIIAPEVPSTFTVFQNGESWYLDVIPAKTPNFTPGNGVQRFQMRLHAAYPYWRTTESYAQQVAGLNALFKFPFFTGGRWWVSRFDDNYFATLKNDGNVPVPFRVVFTARSSLSNPELYHMGTQKRIRIVKEMSAGETISVSTVYGSTSVVHVSPFGEISNGFKHLSVNSDPDMTLQPGTNLLRIAADMNREGLGVRVEAPKGVRSGV